MFYIFKKYVNHDRHDLICLVGSLINIVHYSNQNIDESDKSMRKFKAPIFLPDICLICPKRPAHFRLTWDNWSILLWKSLLLWPNLGLFHRYWLFPGLFWHHNADTKSHWAEDLVGFHWEIPSALWRKSQWHLHYPYCNVSRYELCWIWGIGVNETSHRSEWHRKPSKGNFCPFQKTAVSGCTFQSLKCINSKESKEWVKELTLEY